MHCKGYFKKCQAEAVRGFEGMCEKCFTHMVEDSDEVLRNDAENTYFDPEVPVENWDEGQ